jgi:hypothetical protein
MHNTSEDEMLKSGSFHCLEYVPHLDCLISATTSSSASHLKLENEAETEDSDDDSFPIIVDVSTIDITESEAAALS